MTQEMLDKTTATYVENVKSEILENGGMFSHLVVFGTHKSKPNSPGVIHVPMEEEFLRTSDTKDFFIEVILPKIAKQVKKQFNIDAVGWASEAWIHSGDEDDDGETNRRECFVINLEYLDKTHMIAYEMVRVGKKVNEDGDLIDNIDLIPMKDEVIEKDSEKSEKELKGRFNNLLKHFV